MGQAAPPSEVGQAAPPSEVGQAAPPSDRVAVAYSLSVLGARDQTSQSSPLLLSALDRELEEEAGRSRVAPAEEGQSRVGQEGQVADQHDDSEGRR